MFGPLPTKPAKQKGRGYDVCICNNMTYFILFSRIPNVIKPDQLI